MSKIKKNTLFMYLPDTESCWGNHEEKGHWFTLRGTHDIQEIDGKFYNHYNETPKLVSNGENRLILTFEEVLKFGENIKINDFALKDMVSTSDRYRYSKEDIQKIAKRTSSGITYVILQLIEEGFFSRRILLKHGYNHSFFQQNIESN